MKRTDVFARGGWRAHAACLGAAAALCTGLPAHAENYALITTIGRYTDLAANLPGIDKDAQMARKIAAAMGVPSANVIEMKDEQLTLPGMSKAISDLVNRIKSGDKVFWYHSGHGQQRENVSGSASPCSEGLVTHDMQTYFDLQIDADLTRLGKTASLVVVMDDVCFSGGISTKALGTRAPMKLTPKFFPASSRKAASDSAATLPYVCGTAVNKGFSKNLEVVERAGARVVYMGASTEREIANATPDGSVATQAWLTCVGDPKKADKDNSGGTSGEELRACAQGEIDKMQVNQHVTVSRSPELTVSFVSTPAVQGTTVVPSLALRDISAGADKAYPVKLTVANRTLRINQDFLDFEVQINRPGYLYLFQVGSDGKTVNILFPNKLDANNHLPAGSHKFPRAAWAVKASGPPGTDHVMALLSDEPKDFLDLSKQKGVFGSVPAKRGNMKNLEVVATGATPGGQGRYGASEVVQVTEVP